MDGESMKNQEKYEMKFSYVQYEYNGKSVASMVDIGVTHNFLREYIV